MNYEYVCCGSAGETSKQALPKLEKKLLDAVYFPMVLLGTAGLLWFLVSGATRPFSVVVVGFEVPTGCCRTRSYSHHQNVLYLYPGVISQTELARSPSLDASRPSSDGEASSALDHQASWLDLTADGGVRKKVLVEASSSSSPDQPNPEEGGSTEDGSTITIISYMGKLANAHWSAEEVISCWLSEQQGLGDDDDVIASFRRYEIDESKLTDVENFFTESFVQDTLLGITASKIACKKLVMAAKRLKTTRSEYPAGMEFDSNDRYEIKQGGGGGNRKIIRGMQIGIDSMRVREVAMVRIRSDYGYGSEGYRKRTGEVVVPPFATLEFEIIRLV